MKPHHVAITVSDLDRSVAFYKEHLGFKKVGSFAKPNWNAEAVILELKNLQLEIFCFENYENTSAKGTNLRRIGLNHVGIQVESIQDKYKELKAKNIDIDEPVKGTACTAFCFLRDPDGISIELYEE